MLTTMLVSKFLVVGQKNTRAQSAKADKELYIYITIFDTAVGCPTAAACRAESCLATTCRLYRPLPG